MSGVVKGIDFEESKSLYQPERERRNHYIVHRVRNSPILPDWIAGIYHAYFQPGNDREIENGRITAL